MNHDETGRRPGAMPFGSKDTARDVLEGVDLTGRRYVVTGGASGIGLETTAALLGAGGEVVVAARDVEAARQALAEYGGLEGVRVERLDLLDLATVRQFVAKWEGPLHGLVENAGVMALPDRMLSPEGWERQLAVNYLGHFALALGLHDALERAEDARVTVVSSSAHLRSPFHFEDPHFDVRPYERWSAYAQSKTADVLLAVGIAQRWSDDGIAANSLMPGSITTNLQRHLDDDTLRSLGAMDENGRRVEQEHFKTPAQGASTTVLVAASPLLDGVTGRYFEDNAEAKTIVDTEGQPSGVAAYALDPEAASRLWGLGLSTLERA